jgi:pyruvate,orthophosphate dikinase
MPSSPHCDLVQVCHDYNTGGKKLPANVWDDVLAALKKVEKHMEMKFGDPSAPLLVSVRSGAAVSMPGMMDTVLNLGLNDEVVEGLAKRSNERFAYDSYSESSPVATMLRSCLQLPHSHWPF